MADTPGTEARVSWGMAEPRTDAGRLAHLAWHEEDGPKALLTGDPGCGNVGCGLLGTILAIEHEAVAAHSAALRAAVEGLREAEDLTPATVRERAWNRALVAVLRLLSETAVPRSET